MTNSREIFEGWNVSLVTNPYDFGADPDQDPDPGILTEFLLLYNSCNCKNFASNTINNDYHAQGFVRCLGTGLRSAGACSIGLLYILYTYIIGPKRRITFKVVQSHQRYYRTNNNNSEFV